MSIEELSKKNGITYWLASELSEILGYSEFKTFKNSVLVKAQKTYLDIIGKTPEEDFISLGSDYKLTRLGLFLCVQSADDKKEEVKKARIELAVFTENLLVHLERIEKRKELTSSETEMCRIASAHGLDSKKFGIFKDQGYRGLYNMSLKELKSHKGFDSAKGILYDYMGTPELAYNNFKNVLTSANIKNNNITDEKAMFKIHNSIGREVREQVIKYTRVAPETLPLEENPIKQIRKETKNKMVEIKNKDKKE